MGNTNQSIHFKPVTTITLLFILLFSLGLSTRRVSAHGGAEITVSPTVVAPGGTITIKGEGVEAGESFTISLEGISFSTVLGEVTVGDDEDFHEDYDVPIETPPGPYQIIATSAEGETITAELTVEAGIKTDPLVAETPSNELMKLDRGKSSIELGVIIVGLLIATSLGIVLVRVKE